MRYFVACIAVTSVFLCGSTGAQTFAPLLERYSWQRSDLTEHVGQSYLQTFLGEAIGIDAEIDGDFSKVVTVVDADAVIAMMGTFDAHVAERIYRDFRDGKAGLVRALEHVEGQAIASKDLDEVLRPFTDAEAKPNSKRYALAEAVSMALLASGSGTLIILDDDNYFYNVGYEDDDRSSGRSYGIAAGRLLLDATDNGYLSAIDAYLGPTNEGSSAFYAVLFDLLTRSDPRGLVTLPEGAREVLTDFMTVYTAELERNEMAALSPTTAPWQIDLAKVTLLTAYGGASGMALKRGQLIKCPANAYYVSGGIGGTRAEFMRLARLITQFETAHHPELVFNVVALTPLTDAAVVASVEGDVFRRALSFLNRRETIAASVQNAFALNAAMIALLAQVRADHAAITTFVKASLGPGSVPCVDP